MKSMIVPWGAMLHSMTLSWVNLSSENELISSVIFSTMDFSICSRVIPWILDLMISSIFACRMDSMDSRILSTSLAGMSLDPCVISIRMTLSSTIVWVMDLQSIRSTSASVQPLSTFFQILSTTRSMSLNWWEAA